MKLTGETDGKKIVVIGLEDRWLYDFTFSRSMSRYLFYVLSERDPKYSSHEYFHSLSRGARYDGGTVVVNVVWRLFCFFFLKSYFRPVPRSFVSPSVCPSLTLKACGLDRRATKGRATSVHESISSKLVPAPRNDGHPFSSPGLSRSCPEDFRLKTVREADPRQRTVVDAFLCENRAKEIRNKMKETVLAL